MKFVSVIFAGLLALAGCSTPQPQAESPRLPLNQGKLLRSVVVLDDAMAIMLCEQQACAFAVKSTPKPGAATMVRYTTHRDIVGEDSNGAQHTLPQGVKVTLVEVVDGRIALNYGIPVFVSEKDVFALLYHNKMGEPIEAFFEEKFGVDYSAL